MRVLVVIPAFREEKSIGPIVLALRGQGLAVVVVDDCSPDRTSEVASRMGAIVIRLSSNLGYGGALQTGYLYARAHGYDALVQLDADGQHSPADVPAVLAPILSGEADVVLGSRFLGGPSYPVPRLRRLGQKSFGRLVQWQTGREITDPTTGYQALSRGVIEACCTDIFPEDFPDADMILTLLRMGFRVKEVPVRMQASAGASMHRGVLRPLYYVYKMSVAMLAARCRPAAGKEPL